MDNRIISCFGGWATGVLLVIVALALDFLFVAGAYQFRAMSLFEAEPPSIIVLTSQLSLLAIWLGLGNSSLLIRVAVAVAAGFALMSMVGRQIEPFIRLSVVPLMSMPTFAMRMFGFRIVRSGPQPSSKADVRRPAQYSLQQMFWLTAIVAIEALIIRFWLDSAATLSRRELVSFEGDNRKLELIWLLVLAIANPAVVAIVFRKAESTAAWLFALVLTAFVGGTITSVGSGLPSSVSGSFFVAGWLVFHFALVTAALVLFRHRRYRLIRLPLSIVQDTVASAVEGK